MEKQLTEKNIAVLLWLKALHDFKEEDFANSTFQEKLNAFESVEDIGISRRNLKKKLSSGLILMFLKKMKIQRNYLLAVRDRNYLNC